VVGGAGVPVGLGFAVPVGFETPLHEIKIAHAGTNSASEIEDEITDSEKNLLRTRHLGLERPKPEWLVQAEFELASGRNRSD
jgi:hypothetical protein